ncbi:Copper binding protein, plastocyanin/azurin family [Methanosarcina siciliae HI350]|uniref:Copper binding protein, plastocyanin/azurin family n=1 Tax=Methanosarcina siciliae HI350 TaxID=1434119 RepID=A0A0E3PDN7_9EURY|nr:cupredoxin family copper-binding protein [Methanosarcina siciliae]AKB32282.1 Copper binding protein, plastocyanin/azurin family [Methanosarcina siciliae HI350]
MRRDYIIFIILLWILAEGCAENGVEESDLAVTPVETPVVPAEVPQAPAEIVENPENYTSNQTPVENVTVPEAEIPAEPKTVEVKIEDFAFNPDSVTISPGDTVRWTNLDLFTHKVTGPDFSSGTLRDGDSYGFTFTREGTYRYYCSIHASMEGVVIVEG